MDTRSMVQFGELHRSKRRRGLLLKEIIEGGAGVVGAARRWGGGSDYGSIAGRCRIARHGNPRFKQLAIVRLVLEGNPYRDGLQTLETRRRLEVRALLAAVQRIVTLGTLASKIDIGRQHGRAVVAARGGYRLYHSGQPRPRDIDRRLGALRRTRTILAEKIMGKELSGTAMRMRLPQRQDPFYCKRRDLFARNLFGFASADFRGVQRNRANTR